SNGGATKCHMPALGSPVIDQGSNPAALTTDQRGFKRAVGAGYDIGAVEVQPTSVVSINRADPNPTSAGMVTWAVTFADAETGLSSSNFALSGPGAVGASVTNVSGGGASWMVTAATGAEGGLGLDMTSPSGLSALPNNLPFTGQVYTVDKLPLTANVIATPA